jgi:hypothetical protein
MVTWTLGEKNVIVTAAATAPSVHNTQPWVLELHDEGRAELYVRLERALPHHDPLGRDRLISCGAALQHVLLAMRVLGWVPETTLFPRLTGPTWSLASPRRGARSRPMWTSRHTPRSRAGVAGASRSARHRSTPRPGHGCSPRTEPTGWACVP